MTVCLSLLMDIPVLPKNINLRLVTSIYIITWLVKLLSYVSVRLGCFRMKSHGKTRVSLTVCSSCFNY